MRATLEPNQTVLVVEDDPVNVRIFQKILKRRGNFNAVHSENVLEIFELTASGAIDLVLMDVSLTNSCYDNQSVDGLWIAKALKCDPHTQNLPIILVTANAMVGDRERFLAESGANDYVSKPIIDQSQFVELIRKYLTVNPDPVLSHPSVTSLQDPPPEPSTQTPHRSDDLVHLLDPSLRNVS
ncbi:MAG: response regulator [Oscillatoriales cyanobacterium]|nr:MAG: response regulator [Oscillatoriales cyanobacterium]